MEILKAESISKRFGEKQVLNNVSITLNEGEIISLLGVSGSGKTTLFNILSGIYTPDTGTVLLKGENITGKPGAISYMLQKDLLFPQGDRQRMPAADFKRNEKKAGTAESRTVL